MLKEVAEGTINEFPAGISKEIYGRTPKRIVNSYGNREISGRNPKQCVGSLEEKQVWYQ